MRSSRRGQLETTPEPGTKQRELSDTALLSRQPVIPAAVSSTAAVLGFVLIWWSGVTPGAATAACVVLIVVADAARALAGLGASRRPTLVLSLIAFSALAFGSMQPLLAAEPAAVRWLWLALTIGTCAAGAYGMASVRPAVYLWIVPMLAPAIFTAVFMRDATGLAQAVVAAFFLVVQLRTSLRSSDRMRLAAREGAENARFMAQMREQMTVAAQASQEKTRFLAAAAHDLRQPLHALGLFGAALEQRLRGAAERPLMQNMMRSIEALEASFSAMLDVSRLDAGAVRPSIQTFHVRDVFRRMYFQFAGEAEQKGLSLRFRAAGRIVRSDPQLLERIISNLIHNAIRYTSAGGGVLVAARRCPGHGQVSIEVRDAGIGIAPENLDLVFQEFYQIGNAERDRSKGLGMGLAIVRRLCDLLDHPIQVRSQPGRGSVFKVLVPAALEGLPELVQLGADTLPPREARRLSVLLIDDEEPIRKGMQELFAPWHIELLTASDIAEACERVRSSRSKIDFVISDLRLRGDEDGLRAIHEVRRLVGASVPAVIITGETAAEKLRLANESGMVVLFKPLQPKEILRLINRLPA